MTIHVNEPPKSKRPAAVPPRAAVRAGVELAIGPGTADLIDASISALQSLRAFEGYIADSQPGEGGDFSLKTLAEVTRRADRLEKAIVKAKAERKSVLRLVRLMLKEPEDKI